MKQPAELHTITPYFTVSNADQLIEFLVSAFEGELLKIDRYENGKVQHARVCIKDCVIMLNEANDLYPVNVSQMHLFVVDVQSSYSKALAAGANSLMEPNVRPHGDHMAGVKDPCGNIWWLAMHIEKKH